MVLIQIGSKSLQAFEFLSYRSWYIFFSAAPWSLLLHGTETDAHSVCVGTEALAVRKRDDNRSEFPEPVCGDLLRGDVLLEGLRVDATELAGISVGGQRVVRAGGVIAAAAKFDQVV